MDEEGDDDAFIGDDMAAYLDAGGELDAQVLESLAALDAEDGSAFIMSSLQWNDSPEGASPSAIAAALDINVEGEDEDDEEGLAAGMLASGGIAGGGYYSSPNLEEGAADDDVDEEEEGGEGEAEGLAEEEEEEDEEETEMSAASTSAGAPAHPPGADSDGKVDDADTKVDDAPTEGVESTSTIADLDPDTSIAKNGYYITSKLETVKGAGGAIRHYSEGALRVLNNDVIWSLSSAKPGSAVAELLSDDVSSHAHTRALSLSLSAIAPSVSHPFQLCNFPPAPHRFPVPATFQGPSVWP
jgi:hypothetical protein